MTDGFELELKMGILDEAGQLITDAEQCFLQLESNPQDIATLEKIFRIAHNIKGSSKAVGFDALGAFTHEFETFMLKCKGGEIPITPDTISLLLKCNDHIKQFLSALRSDPNSLIQSDALIQEIQQFQDKPPSAEATISESPSVNEEETISLDEVSLVENHESAPVISVPVVSPPAVPPPSPSPAPHSTSDESIRVSLQRVEKLINFVGELVIYQTVLREQSEVHGSELIRKTAHQMEKVVKEVQDISMGLRMMPLKPTFQKMQRIIRDTSALLNKKVHLVLQGEDNEVDKTVLEALSDPLVHLIRNAVDHGIEVPAERVAKGKSEVGTITLNAYHEAGRLMIQIQDDGGGIDPEKLKTKAIEKGILRAGHAISEKEAIHLIFHAGFSTKAQVTEVSGRGVGMDVVKTNIEKLQGQVLVETVLGKGSVFTIVLPLTLAIIDGMVVRCGAHRYVVPLSHVHETVRTEAKALRSVAGLGEILLLRGENLPVIRVGHALGLPKTGTTDAPADHDPIAIIVRTQEQAFAAVVDDVLGQHQVVIKKLGSEVQSVKGLSGSAILGDGKPALILELQDFLSHPRKAAA